MKKLLYVEDSTISLKIINKTLPDSIVLIGAQTITEAENYLRNEGPFDCILIDYNLPTGNGIEFGKRLRRIPKFKKTPLILTSASLDEDIIQGADSSGFNQCISKMSPPKKIREQILQQLENHNYKHFSIDKVVYNCVAWEHNNEYFQYSPDFKFIVHGKTEELAHKQMEKLLASHKNSAHKIWNPKVVQYKFKITP